MRAGRLGSFSSQNPIAPERIREVRQGPDGLPYVLTDHNTDGALLRIEPAR